MAPHCLKSRPNVSMTSLWRRDYQMPMTLVEMEDSSLKMALDQAMEDWQTLSTCLLSLISLWTSPIRHQRERKKKGNKVRGEN